MEEPGSTWENFDSQLFFSLNQARPNAEKHFDNERRRKEEIEEIEEIIAIVVIRKMKKKKKK